MFIKQRWVIARVALFLAIVACQPPGQPAAGEEETEAVAEEAAEEAVPAEAGGEAAAEAVPEAPQTFAYTGVGIEQLSSYSAQLTVTFEGTNPRGEPARWLFTADTAQQQDPPALSLLATTEAEGLTGLGESGDISYESGETMIMMVDGTIYSRSSMSEPPGACFAFEGLDASSFLEGFFSVEDFVSATDVPELTLVDANESVNGVPSSHYRASGISGESLNNATVDVWMAHDGGYATRIELADSGEMSDFGSGDLALTYELLTVNQPLELTPPEDCEPLGG